MPVLLQSNTLAATSYHSNGRYMYIVQLILARHQPSMLWRVGKGRRLKMCPSWGDNNASSYLRSDWWLIRGISKFVGGLFCRKAFGNTDYLYWVREELQKVCLYEAEHTLPPLCSSISPSPSAASSKDNHGSPGSKCIR